MKARFFSDHLILYSGNEAPWFFLALGVILFFGGLFLMSRIPQQFKAHAPVVGFLIALVSALALVLGEGVTITIDKKKQHIHILEQRGFLGRAQTTFAFNNFTHAEVLHHLSLSKEPKIGDDEKVYVLQLIRSNNMPIELGFYEDEEKLRGIIEHLRKIVPFETYLIAPPDHVDDNFYKQFVNEVNVQVSYEYPIYLPPDDPSAITPPEHKSQFTPSLTISHGKEYKELSWYKRKSVFWITIIDLIIFSLLILLYRLIVIFRNFSRLTVSVYVILVLSGVICGAVTLATFAGRSHVRFQGRNIIYSTTLLGITAYENRITRADVLSVSNSLTMDWNTNLTVLTPRGLTLLIRTQTESENSVAEDFESAILNPKDYRMKIDVSPLTIQERLLLEEEVMNKE